MSYLKISKAGTNSVAVLGVTDTEKKSHLDVWAYADSVLFQVDTQIVRMSPNQFERLAEFVRKQQKIN